MHHACCCVAVLLCCACKLSDDMSKRLVCTKRNPTHPGVYAYTCLRLDMLVSTPTHACVSSCLLFLADAHMCVSSCVCV